MEAFESAGQWWLPERPERQVIGLLTFSKQDGFRLEIPFGSLEEEGEVPWFGRESDRRPMVHGFLRDGRYVTLVDTLTVNSDWHVPGTGHEELHALKGFVGKVSTEANPLVDRASVSYSHLRDWVLWHPSTSTHPRLEDGFRLGAGYEYQSPEDVVLADGDGWKILLGHTASLSMPSVEGFHVDHDCQLTIELAKPLPFDELSAKFLDPLWAFLYFLPLPRRQHHVPENSSHG
jgi:hypothetical protein